MLKAKKVNYPKSISVKSVSGHRSLGQDVNGRALEQSIITTLQFVRFEPPG